MEKKRMEKKRVNLHSSHGHIEDRVAKLIKDPFRYWWIELFSNILAI